MYKVYIKRIGYIDQTKVSFNILEYINRYNNIERYNQSLNAWFLLQEVLLSDFNIDISKKKIRLTKNNKPFIKGIHFSISHSKDMVCLIVSNNLCGIDIEKIDESIKHDKLAKRVFTNEELISYNNASNKLDYFVKKWTKKEAYLKCFNDGIRNIESLKVNQSVKTLKVIDYFDSEYYISYITK